jgi:hypothetical protein
VGWGGVGWGGVGWWVEPEEEGARGDPQRWCCEGEGKRVDNYDVGVGLVNRR